VNINGGHEGKVIRIAYISVYTDVRFKISLTQPLTYSFDRVKYSRTEGRCTRVIDLRN